MNSGTRRVAARCLAFIIGLSLTACIPGLPGLTLSTPLPPATLIVLSPASEPTASPLPATPSPTEVINTDPTFTPIPTLTATGYPPTALTLSFTPTAALPTETGTVLESVSLDKLPPDTVYKHVRIENQSHSQMDISLHCTTKQGLQTVLEYEHVKNLGIEAPNGNYVYVVYVGGRQIVGTFSLLGAPGATITVYSDRVTIH